MRQLIVTTVSPTLGAFLIPFSRRFRELGWEVGAAAAGLSKDEALCREFDFVHDIPWSRSLASTDNYRKACPALRQIVLEHQYDLVHVHTPIAAFLTRFALRKLRPKVKVVYTAHGFHFGYSGRSPYLSPFFYVERVAAAWTDGLIVINREDFDTARKYRLLDEDRLFYSPGIGVDLDRYGRHSIRPSEIAAVRSELGLQNGDVLLLMLAEFIPRKRHHDLLRAFELLARPDVHVAFAGDGPLFEEITTAAGRLKFSEHLHFLGYRRDIPALIAAADATILPSRQEGLPRSVMESMALGTPVLGTRIRGIVELLSDECGLLFDVGNAAQMSSAIQEIASNPERRQILAANARQKIARYSQDSVLALHERIYAQVLRTKT
jgi:glycosyltransferase involved in cell wall biosynthesis